MRQTAVHTLHHTREVVEQQERYLDKLLNGLGDISVELFDVYSRQVHVAEQTVDDLEERLLHAGKALIQQLRDEE